MSPAEMDEPIQVPFEMRTQGICIRWGEDLDPIMGRTGINGESTSMVWPTLGSRTAKEQNRTWAGALLGQDILENAQECLQSVHAV